MPSEDLKEKEKLKLHFVEAQEAEELRELLLKVGGASAETDTIGKQAQICAELNPSSLLSGLIERKSGPFCREEAIELIIKVSGLIGDFGEFAELGAYSGFSGSLTPESISIIGDQVFLDKSKQAKLDSVYRAPETRRGEITDPASSYVYALGVILYEMLSNKSHSAVQNPDLCLDLSKWLAYSPEWGTVDGRLKEIIRKAVEPEPALRYASSKELKEVLENYLKPGRMQVLEPPLSKTRESSGRKLVFAALVVLVYALTCLFVLSFSEINRNNSLPLHQTAEKTYALVVLPAASFDGAVSYNAFKSPDPTSTTLSMDAEGKFSGTYLISEKSGTVEGSLKEISRAGNEISLAWQDKYGTGKLVIKAEGNKGFSGYWTHDHSPGIIQGSWSGRLP